MQLSVVMSIPPSVLSHQSHFYSPHYTLSYTPLTYVPVLDIYSDTWGPLFCFNFPHTRKRKNIAWHSVSQYLCVIVSSTSICFSANGRILFFLLNEWHFFVYVYHTFFVHSSVDKHLSWCHNLAYKNSATINIIMQLVCANFISSGYFCKVWNSWIRGYFCV